MAQIGVELFSKNKTLLNVHRLAFFMISVCLKSYATFRISCSKTKNPIPFNLVIISSISESQEPEEKDFITTNSSCINLQLSLWNNGGCPISHFSIEHRPHGKLLSYFQLQEHTNHFF